MYSSKKLERTMNRVSRLKDEEAQNRIAEWIDFLRHDDDTSWSCIVSVLRYKLWRVRSQLVRNKILADYKKVSAEIRKVERLLGRIESNYYFEEAQRAAEKRYVKRKRPESIADVKIQFAAVHELAAQRLQRDLEEALGLMSKNILKWWD